MQVPMWSKQFPAAFNKPHAPTLPHTDKHTAVVELPKISYSHTAQPSFQVAEAG